MKRSVKLFIEDILESITNIESFTRGISKSDLMKNKEKQSAVIRQLEIIGESIKNIPTSLKEKYPEVRWKGIAGLRDILTHSYFKVDLNLVWKIIEEDLSELKESMLKIKKDLNNEF
ncbi:MAG: DUF86 domain-containing protein [archaeon]